MTRVRGSGPDPSGPRVDLDRELASIPPPGEEADPRPLGLAFRGLLIQGGQAVEEAVEAGRNEPVQRLAYELFFRPSEKPFDLVIQCHDPAERVDHDSGVEGCLEQRSEPDVQQRLVYHGEASPGDGTASAEGLGVPLPLITPAAGFGAGPAPPGPDPTSDPASFDSPPAPSQAGSVQHGPGQSRAQRT